MSFRNLIAASAVALCAVTFAACGHSADKSAKGTSGGDDGKVAVAGHTHEGWWCAEHGVPEEECARCDTKLVGEFKAKGDWCEEHNRPESQCFICHPEKEAEFAARYEDKYGEKPPKPTADEHEAGEKHEHNEKS